MGLSSHQEKLEQYKHESKSRAAVFKCAKEKHQILNKHSKGNNQGKFSAFTISGHSKKAIE